MKFHVDLFSFFWVVACVIEFQWVFVILKISLIDFLIPKRNLIGFNSILLGFTGFYRVFIGFHGVLLVFTGFYRVLPGFTGFHRVIPSFTEFYRVLLGFTRFQWGLLACTVVFIEFSQVFTGFYRVSSEVAYFAIEFRWAWLGFHQNWSINWNAVSFYRIFLNFNGFFFKESLIGLPCYRVP